MICKAVTPLPIGYIGFALAASLALSSCYKATIRLQEPRPAVTSAVTDNEMHMSLLGIVELSEPVDLAGSCATEAVAIEESLSVTGGIINAILGTYIPVLQVMNPTVTCATE